MFGSCIPLPNQGLESKKQMQKASDVHIELRLHFEYSSKTIIVCLWPEYFCSWVVVLRASNPNIRETEEGGSLWISGQPGIVGLRSNNSFGVLALGCGLVCCTRPDKLEGKHGAWCGQRPSGRESAGSVVTSALLCVCEFVFFIVSKLVYIYIYIVVGFRFKPNLHHEFQDSQVYIGRPCSKQNRRFCKHCLQKALFFTMQTRYVS